MHQTTLNFGNMTLTRAGHGEDAGKKLEWLVENIWVRGGTGMLAGPPKTGKTWLIIDLAVSIASGTPFLGRFPATQGPVLLYSPEGPVACLDDRIHQVAARRGLDHADLEIYTVKANGLSLDSQEDQKTIIKVVESIKPMFAIFDPLAECFGGEENRSDDVKVMTNFLTLLAREYGVSNLLSHHLAKANGKKGLDRLRGSGVLAGFGDSYLFLDPLKNKKIKMETIQRNGTPADDCILELSEKNNATAYTVVDACNDADSESPDLGDRILILLLKSGTKLSQRDIRLELKGTYGKYPPALKELKGADLIAGSETQGNGWELTESGKETAEELKKSGAVRPLPIGANRTAPVED